MSANYIKNEEYTKEKLFPNNNNTTFPLKQVVKPPIENIMTLQKCIKNVLIRKKPLVKELRLLMDIDYIDFKTDDEIEKLEEELVFLNSQYKIFSEQIVTIMNEHNVKNIPPMLDYDTL